MLERDVNIRFKQAFGNYNLFPIQTNTSAGWPDKMLQMPNSRIIFIELKHIVMNKNATFRLTDFRSEQAAFFAKWQRSGGKCFIFVGISSSGKETLGYGTITLWDWKEWLECNKLIYSIGDMAVFSDSNAAILKWFRKWVDE